MPYEAQMVKLAEGAIRVHGQLKEVVFLEANKDSLLNVVDILSYKMLLMTEAAVRQVEQLWGKRSSL